MRRQLNIDKNFCHAKDGIKRTDVPALRKQDSQKEEHKTDNGTDPSVEDERG